MDDKIKILFDADGVKVIGNRRGLTGLAEICLQLAQLPEDVEESRRLGNHYHYRDRCCAAHS